MNDNWYIVSWDIQGVEHLEDITKYHPDKWIKDQLLDVIGGAKVKNNPLNHLITSISFRARYNSQRFYECYIFTSSPDIDYDSIQSWTRTDPQGFADWVREFHMSKILDHRAPDHNNRTIT